MSDLIKNNPYQHICVMIISFFIFEMLLIIGCLKIVFVADLFGLYSAFTINPYRFIRVRYTF